MSKKISKRILITNAGSTVSQAIINYSRNDFSWLGGTDMNKFCYAAKALGKNFFTVPEYKDWANYKKSLLKICREQKVDLVIPCAIDQELLWLARDRREFEALGIKILASDYTPINICNDKYNFFKFISGLDIKTPKTYLPQTIDRQVNWPIFLKKRQGEGSAVMQKIDNKTESNYFLKKFKNVILQELIRGEEISVDMVLSNSSEVEFACCRKRLAVKAGICTKTEFIEKRKLIKAAALVAKKLKLIGGINVQFIDDYLIEINPRFPGGMGLDCQAGFNMPLMAVKAFFGQPIDKSEKKIKAKKILRIWQDILYE